jgi:glycosyltransferase involved in cell wall biosynthesis
MKLRLIYLGTKGGGAELFRELRTLSFGSEQNSIEYVCSDMYIVGEEEPALSNVDYVIPGIRTITRKPWLFAKFVLICFRLSKSKSKVVNVFLLPSPQDAILHRILRLRGEKSVFLIHDATPHPGELWPRKKSIDWRIEKGDGLVFLSEHVRRQAEKKLNKGNTVVLAHPPYNFLTTLSENVEPVKNSGKSLPKMLFMGRVRKYKGINQLVDFKELIQDRFQLVIAGQGNLPSGVKDFEIHNYWLSESEMSRFLADADVVIFPYIEASQSGIIPAAIQLNKVIIVSRIGGLVEQVENYPRAFTFTIGDRGSFLEALTKAEISVYEIGDSKKYSGSTASTSSFSIFYRDLIAFIGAL